MMDRATQVGEPLAYDCADRMEEAGLDAVEEDASSWPWG